MTEPNSMKEDKEVFKTELWVGEGYDHTVRLYRTGHTIDCYHRLRLTPDDLRKLFAYTKMKNKSNKAYEDDREKYDLLADKAQVIWEDFIDGFKNPYKLDIERIDEGGGSIGYVFYDYDYDYYVIHARNGWYTYCTISDTYGSGEFCECDTAEIEKTFADVPCGLPFSENVWERIMSCKSVDEVLNTDWSSVK